MKGPTAHEFAAGFADPAAEHRPRWRWWWPSSFDRDEAARELAAMRDAGFAGAEITWMGSLWATPEQRAALGAVLETADDLQMDIDMTLAAGWPITSPVLSDTGLGQRELQYGRLDLSDEPAGPLVIPHPLDDRLGVRDAELIAVTAARVLRRGPVTAPPLDASGPGMPNEDGNTEPPDSSTVLRAGSLIDLTERVSDRTIHWAGEPGEWVVLAFWSRTAQQRGGSVVGLFETEGLEAALEHVDAEQLGEENEQLLRRVGGHFFEDSLECHAASIFWAHDLLESFSERFGYRLEPLLPLLFVQGMARFWVPVDPPVADFELERTCAEDVHGAGVRADYYSLLDDLYARRHLQVLSRWAQRRGRRLRCQPAYGLSLNVSRAAREAVRAGALVEVESLNAGGWGGAGETLPLDVEGTFWRFALDHYRSMVSGAHQAGQNAVTSELGAAGRPFALTLTEYKGLVDNQWAAGVTTPIPHGFVLQVPDDPWPGTSWAIVSEQWHDRTYPQWEMWRPLSDYWARGAHALSGGIARCDVAVLHDGFVTVAARNSTARDAPPRPLYDSGSLEMHGFGVQYVDSVGVLESPLGADGALYPDGPAYRALIICQRSLAPEVAARLVEFARAGLAIVIVGEVPNLPASGRHGAGTELTTALARLLKVPTVQSVAGPDDVAEALRRLGVRPRIALHPPAPVLSQYRQHTDARVIYLFNPTPHPVRSDVLLDVTGRPEQLDLWTGAVSEIAQARRTDRGLSISVALPARGNLLLRVVEDDGYEPRGLHTDAEHVAVGPDGAIELHDSRNERRLVSRGAGPTHVLEPQADSIMAVQLHRWSLDVIESTPHEPRTPHRLTMAPLIDWREHPVLKDAAGWADYRTSTTVSASDLGQPVSWWLDLGEVAGGSAQVSVNGVRAHPSPVLMEPIDVSDLLRVGSNEVSVRFTSTLLNRVAFDGRSQRTGLLGPVRLLRYHRIPVPDDL